METKDNITVRMPLPFDAAQLVNDINRECLQTRAQVEASEHSSTPVTVRMPLPLDAAQLVNDINRECLQTRAESKAAVAKNAVK